MAPSKRESNTPTLPGPGDSSPDARARAFNEAVNAGYLAKATRILTRDSGGGLLALDEIDVKTGKKVLEVMKDKHPRAAPVDANAPGIFEEYDFLPDQVKVTITPAQIRDAAERLQGSGGPDGVDAVECKRWILRHGLASAHLQAEMAQWANWLGNDKVAWARTRAFMAARSIPLDKEPGVRPVGVGCIFRRVIAKAFLEEARPQATSACGISNLCCGLAAGIEGAFNAAEKRLSEFWEKESGEAGAAPHGAQSEGGDEPPEHVDTSPDDISLSMEDSSPESCADPEAGCTIDADNGFNNQRRLVMLWTVRHLWPSGFNFVMNCYQNAAILVLRCAKTGKCYFLALEEGVVQGDPISMICYGLSMVPLQQQLVEAVPGLTQPWFADDSTMIGPASLIRKAADLLLEWGPHRGYHPQPAKCVVVGTEATRDAIQQHLGQLGSEFKLGTRYVGGFLGDEALKEGWVREQVDGMVRGVKELAHAA